ncbi:oxalurate catabolism protein HpxX [Ewingella americana]|nr:oxalurate catabolism protein HpxX [Ewingella americana]
MTEIKNMTKGATVTDWAAYTRQMEAVLGLELDDARRQEVLVQFSRIAQMAEPLMALPLDSRLEIAGVYRA